MFIIHLCFRSQKVRIRVFSLTQLYIYYALATCFGPDFYYNQAVE